MILIAALVIGAFLGWRRVGKAGGNRSDRIQYALVFALIFAVLGLFITVLLDRMVF